MEGPSVPSALGYSGLGNIEPAMGQYAQRLCSLSKTPRWSSAKINSGLSRLPSLNSSKYSGDILYRPELITLSENSITLSISAAVKSGVPYGSRHTGAFKCNLAKKPQTALCVILPDPKLVLMTSTTAMNSLSI